MTPSAFNYEMCPIRHFKKMIQMIETFENFVIATDETGVVGIFLINEENNEEAVT
jgi:hypothetical protein